MKDLKRLSLFTAFVLMSLTVIFHVHVGFIWMLVPFIIYVALTGWRFFELSFALIFGFVTKGKIRVMEILEENQRTQKAAERLSHEALETAVRKLTE